MIPVVQSPLKFTHVLTLHPIIFHLIFLIIRWLAHGLQRSVSNEKNFLEHDSIKRTIFSTQISRRCCLLSSYPQLRAISKILTCMKR
jgi:hypothetical protein